jgi:GrpB-like predicted nucleotidyltransferase (UPF0157 family)
MIEIIDYQPRWPDEFVVVEQQLRNALGKLALRIDRIGSTSVPGLAAKDIIDAQVTVRTLEPSLIPRTTNLGFETRLTTMTINPQATQPPKTNGANFILEDSRRAGFTVTCGWLAGRINVTPFSSEII